MTNKPELFIITILVVEYFFFHQGQDFKKKSRFHQFSYLYITFRIEDRQAKLKKKIK